jgi:hypothetical protein
VSILIKGMEMPTDHPLWIVVHSDGTVEANEVSASRPVGWQTLRNAAVPVPEHGRLGDVDALTERFWDGQCYFTDAIKSKLQTAPTVIEAEEGET